MMRIVATCIITTIIKQLFFFFANKQVTSLILWITLSGSQGIDQSVVEARNNKLAKRNVSITISNGKFGQKE